jgi:hypothetical protein
LRKESFVNGCERDRFLEPLPGVAETDWARRIGRLTLWILLLTAGALRLHDLGGKSFWVDEARAIVENIQPFERVLDHCARSHKAPLREYLLHVLLLAPRTVWEPLTRLPSALAGAFSVLLVYWIGRRLLGWLPGVAGALFLAFHPWHLTHSQDGRMHAVVLMLGLLTLGTALRCARRRVGWWSWALLGGFAALSMGFSFLSVQFLPAIAAYICATIGWRLAARRDRAGARRLAFGGALALLCFLPLMAPLLPRAHLLMERYSFWTQSSEAAMDIRTGDETTSPQSQPVQMQTQTYATRFDARYFAKVANDFSGSDRPAVWGVVFGLALIGWLSCVRRRSPMAVIAPFWFLGPLPVLLLTNAGSFFPTRYLLYALGVLAPLVGAGVGVVGEWSRFLRRRPRESKPVPRTFEPCHGLLCLVPILLIHLWRIPGYYDSEFQNWRSAVNFLERNMRARERLVTGDHWTEFGVMLYRNPRKRIELEPRAFDPVLLNQALRASTPAWYIHWAPLPPYVEELLRENDMKLVARYPGMHGDVCILANSNQTARK